MIFVSVVCACVRQQTKLLASTACTQHGGVCVMCCKTAPSGIESQVPAPEACDPFFLSPGSLCHVFHPLDTSTHTFTLENPATGISNPGTAPQPGANVPTSIEAAAAESSGGYVAATSATTSPSQGAQSLLSIQELDVFLGCQTLRVVMECASPPVDVDLMCMGAGPNTGPGKDRQAGGSQNQLMDVQVCLGGVHFDFM